jgi:hypothetical protein
MLPVFDLNFSQFTYDQALMFRMGMWFIMSFMNVAIIFPVYRIVCPSMHYNYHDDLVESIGIKLMND